MDKRKINKIVIDCDGVLTDGKLNIDSTGKKVFKSFHTRDVRSIRELISIGYEVIIISADDWGGTKEFAEKVGAEFISMREKWIEKPYIAVGDDVWDYHLLQNADIKFCPSDADNEIKKIEGITKLRTEGGRGVIAELLKHLIAYGNNNNNTKP